MSTVWLKYIAHHFHGNIIDENSHKEFTKDSTKLKKDLFMKRKKKLKYLFQIFEAISGEVRNLQVGGGRNRGGGGHKLKNLKICLSICTYLRGFRNFWVGLCPLARILASLLEAMQLCTFNCLAETSNAFCKLAKY
jgi:hypothetical protein